MTERYYLIFLDAHGGHTELPVHCYAIHVYVPPDPQFGAFATAFPITESPVPCGNRRDGFTVADTAGRLQAIRRLRIALSSQFANLAVHTNLPT